MPYVVDVPGMGGVLLKMDCGVSRARLNLTPAAVLCCLPLAAREGLVCWGFSATDVPDLMCVCIPRPRPPPISWYCQPYVAACRV